MDVSCPKCQTEYELEEEKVTGEGVTVKCASCGHLFRVKRKQLLVTLPAKEGAATDQQPALRAEPPPPPRPSADLPPPPPSREWKLRFQSGQVVPCRDLTMLQKWIIENKVHRDDQISLTGETWKRLGDIPELGSFFQIVDDVAKARASAPGRDTPPPPPPPSLPDPPKKITDTWREGSFSIPAPLPPVPEPGGPVPEPSAAPRRKTGQSSKEKTAEQTAATWFEPSESDPKAPPAPRPPPPPAEEPTDAELRKAVGGGGGKWAFLVLAGLLVGGGVGYYFGVYRPEQLAAAERASQEAVRDEEARVRAAEEAQRAAQLALLDAGSLDAGALDAGGLDAGALGAGALGAGPDGGAADGGAPDAGGAGAGANLSAPDAGPPVAEKPRTFEQVLAQADRLRERERTAEALDLYGRAHEQKPQRVEPLTGRGLCLLDLGNPNAAEAAFEQALGIAGRYGPAIMGMAESLRLQGKNARAVEFYERYLEVLPDGAEAAVARNSIERLKK